MRSINGTFIKTKSRQFAAADCTQDLKGTTGFNLRFQISGATYRPFNILLKVALCPKFTYALYNKTLKYREMNAAA